MRNGRIGCGAALVCLALILSGCSTIGDVGNRIFGGRAATTAKDIPAPANATAGTPPPVRAPAAAPKRGLLASGGADQVPAIAVNSYLWAATLDVLYFLPVQSADPYTGTIITGYGTAPGASTAYRATVLIQSAALDATSLHLSLMTRSGTAPAETQRALEAAILTRARQLRSAALDAR